MNFKYQNSKFKTLCVSDYSLSAKGAEFEVEYGGQRHQFKTNLLGEFNIYNSLAAIAVGLSQNINVSQIQKALAKMSSVSGRMEVIHDDKRDITVIVDYAHDPAALGNVYQTIRAIKGLGVKSQDLQVDDEVSSIKYQVSGLIAVLGAVGGGRDTAKRPKLGALASKFAKYVIITNEDPYDDDPEEIMRQVEAGVKKDSKRLINQNYWNILDRKAAIKKAIELAHPGDIIALTGKGCEEVMAVKNGFVPWDDRKVVREVLGV